MKLPRRQFLHLAASAAALPTASRFARAQGYPSRPVRIVVGLAAGSSLDILARHALSFFPRAQESRGRGRLWSSKVYLWSLLAGLAAAASARAVEAPLDKHVDVVALAHRCHAGMTRRVVNQVGLIVGRTNDPEPTLAQLCRRVACARKAFLYCRPGDFAARPTGFRALRSSTGQSSLSNGGRRLSRTRHGVAERFQRHSQREISHDKYQHYEQHCERTADVVVKGHPLISAMLLAGASTVPAEAASLYLLANA